MGAPWICSIYEKRNRLAKKTGTVVDEIMPYKASRMCGSPVSFLLGSYNPVLALVSNGQGQSQKQKEDCRQSDHPLLMGRVSPLFALF